MREESFDGAVGGVRAHLAVRREPEFVALLDTVFDLFFGEATVMACAPKGKITIPILAMGPCGGIDGQIRLDGLDHGADGLHLVDDVLMPVVRFVRDVEDEFVVPSFFTAMVHEEPQAGLVDFDVFRAERVARLVVGPWEFAFEGLFAENGLRRVGPSEEIEETRGVGDREFHFVEIPFGLLVEKREIRRDGFGLVVVFEDGIREDVVRADFLFFI